MFLDWKNLVVICTEGDVPNRVKWQAAEGVFPAETCMRHIYVGLVQDFRNVSKELLDDKKTKFMAGAEAYSYFQEFYTGLRGHYDIDIDPSGQARRSWNNYVERNPESYKRMKPYMDAMFHDGALIKTHILNNYTARINAVNMAVRKAELKPEDRALVVCGAVPLSIDVVAALGHKKDFTPNHITITHPDPAVLHAVMNGIRERGKQRSYRRVKAEVVPMRFDSTLWDNERLTNIYNAQAVFVCQPMTQEVGTTLAHINQALFESWHLRSLVHLNHNAKLLHMKGDPLKQGATTGVWAQADGLDNFVSYQDLRSEETRKRQYIRGIVATAKQAIRDMGQMRLEGDWVKQIAFDPEMMRVGYNLAKRPKGPPSQAVQEALQLTA